MKNPVVLLLLVLVSVTCDEKEDGEKTCKYKHYSKTISLDTIQPWPHTAKVEIWSFKRGEAEMEKGKYNIIEHDTVALAADEKVVLNQQQVEMLKDALYSYVVKNEGYLRMCDCMYNPHHAVIFYNSSGRPIAFLEICFECSQMYSQNIYPGVVCSNYYERLNTCFKDVGVTQYIERRKEY